ncbi:hypothetical protein AB0K12_22915 [Nonomuraea sp. NPDC049419]|uniref:hypothetical protein n=1 Tax=Nonomuraea sp. NPDC049419 TaxID=3155772 RepID=UPI00343440E0
MGAGLWAGPGRGMGGPAQLSIARMSDPWTVTGGRVAIPADGGCTEVREGPTPLHRDGRNVPDLLHVRHRIEVF